MSSLPGLILPPYVPPVVEVNRPSAPEINRLENKRQTEMYSGFGEAVPVVYGEQIVSGPRLVDPWPVGGTGYIWAIALSQGPIDAILQARANGGTWVTLNQNGTSSANLGSGMPTVWARYNGSQTVRDSRLAQYIPGFNDAFTGVAYAVIQWGTGTSSTSFPEVEFRVRGRQVLDPRTNQIAWTENPALHMHDMVSNGVWGLNRVARGFEAAADACDSLYSGVPRSRSGLCIQDFMTEREVMDLMASYAEVLWGYDGDAIKVIPDMPVAAPADVLTASQIVGGTLKLDGVGADQMPTQISVVFTDRSESGDWMTRPALAVLPTDAMEGVSATRSEVRLPGVFRRVEAERRAHQRLRHLQTPGRAAWQMWGDGVRYEAGDVLCLPDIRGLRNALIRLTTQAQMIGPGRYQLEGEFYSIDQYPDDGGGTSVPVGGIVPYLGSMPDGYVAWSRTGFLLGDATGGQSLTATPGSVNLAFNQAGGHIGARETVARAGSSAGAPTGIMLANTASEQERGAHPHTATVAHSTLLDALPRESLTWAKKVDAAAPLRSGVGFLAGKAINQQRITAVMAAVGKYLASGTRQSRSAQRSMSGQTSADGEHHHGNDVFELGAGSSTLTLFSPAALHRHQWSAQISARLRAKRLTLYQASDEALVPLGGIIGWEDGAVPPGWRLCDGAAGTIDLRGFFIELAEPAQAGTAGAQANEISLTSIVTDNIGIHNHKRTVNNANIVSFGTSGRHDLESHLHSHTAADRTLTNVLPARQTFRFIQYVGA